MDKMFLLSRADRVKGVYSDYRKAVQALMMNAQMPITDFVSDFGVDFYTDGQGEIWAIEPVDVDKI